MAMDDLVARIKASIENRNGDPWFPELTADLTARAWESLHRDIGLTPDSYGTERVLYGCISAPRAIITSLSASPSACAPTIAIEALTQECAVKYQQKGVSLYSPDEILITTVLACIEEAFAIINQVPSLMRTVVTLVRSLHVIKPEDENHDVSFSEPHIPFSIFVSVPETRIANDALRVAEAIVHETMHLQLTLLERHSRLVSSDAGQYFSPWRGEFRTASGIVHGLYVFAVIEAFLSDVRLQSANEIQTIHYVVERCEQIRNQTAELQSFKQSQHLTDLGFIFVKRLTKTPRFTSCASGLNYL
jgi:hypothetical protein